MKIEILILKDAEIIRIEDVKTKVNQILDISLTDDFLLYHTIEIKYSLKLSARKQFASLTLSLEKENYTNASILSQVHKVGVNSPFG